MRKIKMTKKFLTGLLFTIIFATGVSADNKWETLVFTEDLNMGFVELERYCALHDISVSDVLWANSVASSSDIQAGTSIYLPNSQADMLAIWQNQGAWKPAGLVPVTSAATANKIAEEHEKKLEAKRKKTEENKTPLTKLKEESLIDVQESAELQAKLEELMKVTDAPKLESPAPKTAKTLESDTAKVNPKFPEIITDIKTETKKNNNNDVQDGAELQAKLEELMKVTDAPKLEAPAPKTAKTLESNTAKVNPKFPEIITDMKVETPKDAIAKMAKPDAILNEAPKKNTSNSAKNSDPIIVLSPNGDYSSQGPMRLLIVGDKVEVVRIPENAVPKAPSMADLDHVFGTTPDYLPYYNLTKRPAGNDYTINLRNLGGKMLWPVEGKVSSYFGQRGKRKHEGIDIPMPEGTPIRAAKNGVVVRTGNNSTPGFRGYGNFVLLDHGGGLQSFYAHCSSVGVRQGQRIMQGQVIAQVGNTGRSTANHLHFEVRVNNNKVDPIPYLGGRARLASNSMKK